MVRSADFNKGCLILKADPMLFLQMRYLGYEGMRVAIAYRCGDTIVCGYIRNTAAQEEELAAEERQIGKLSENAGTAFVAYWTEGGILSVRLRNAKKFNDEYYRLRLTGYQWDGEQLLLYVETPLVEGKPQFDLYSLSTGEVCREAQINLKTEWNNRLHRVMKLALDFSDIRMKNVDGYCLLCDLDGLQYQLYMAAEISETDEKIEFVTNSAESFVLCIAQNTKGRFLLQIQNEAYPVMLSVVTAVYNTEPFLAEMIDSVLMQDTKGLERYLIGNETGNFQKKKYRHLYELILVDDGSTDGSADILDDYARLSDSIRVIHKENGGVSSARNAGMEVARGKYINFADSDDKLSKNFFSESLSFLEEHEDEIDITTAPLKFFDKKNRSSLGKL